MLHRNQALQKLLLLMVMIPVLTVQAGKPNPVVRDVSRGSMPWLAGRLCPPSGPLPALVLSLVDEVQRLQSRLPTVAALCKRGEEPKNHETTPWLLKQVHRLPCLIAVERGKCTGGINMLFPHRRFPLTTRPICISSFMSES